MSAWRTLLRRPQRKAASSGWGSLLGLVLVVGCVFVCAPAAALASGFADTTSNIHLGLAYDYDAQPSQVASVASDVDYIFGGYFLNWNFGFYPSVSNNDGYIPFDTDPWPQTAPGHSLADWQATHPDWIVYQCDGKTPAYYGSGNTNVPLDFSNPAVRAWQAQQAGTLVSAGATGIAFDDFTFTNFENRCGVYKNGVWTPLGYPGLDQDNDKLTSDMMGWLQDMRSRLQQQYPGTTLTVNFAASVSGLDKLKMIAPYIDMDFDEAGYTSYGSQRLADSAWQQETDALEYLNSQGKAFDVNGIVNVADDPSVTHDDINWVLANYLLVKGPHSFTYVYAGNNQGYTGSPSGYGTFYDRPEYHVPIGTPTSARYQSQGVQMRDYSGGLAIVNPSSTQTYTITLPTTYQDMYGQTHTTVTLTPTTGIVLLNTRSGLRKAGADRPRRLTLLAAKREVRAVLSRRFPRAFRHRHKYSLSCSRLSAVRIRCRLSWWFRSYWYLGTVELFFRHGRASRPMTAHLRLRRVRRHERAVWGHAAD